MCDLSSFIFLAVKVVELMVGGDVRDSIVEQAITQVVTISMIYLGVLVISCHFACSLVAKFPKRGATC